MSWTDERVETLIAMWNEGKSANQIAKALGGVTRNAVIGKVHRLGLSNRTAARSGAGAARPAGDKPATAEDAAAAVPAEEPAVEAAPEPAEEPVAAPAAAAAASDPAAPQTPPEEAVALPDTPESDVDREAARRAAAQGSMPMPAGAAALPVTSSEVSDEARRNLVEAERNARRLSLLQLTERTCKWPIGDPATEEFYFCGLPAQSGKPYCEAHVAVAFQPMSARRDRSRAR